MKTYRFWIVAAGTGGHIIPGLEIANKLEEIIKEKNQLSEFVFWGTKDRLEAKIIPDTGRRLNFVSAKPWKGTNFFGKLKGLLSCVFSAWVPIVSLFSLGRPSAVISLGGYVSMPVVIAAFLFRIPIFIHEPNIKTGAANKLWGKFAKVVTTIPGSDANNLFSEKAFDFGNPSSDAFSPLPIRSSVKTLLILGGSQGAQSLCISGLNVFKELLQWDKSLRLILQAGVKNLEASRQLAEDLQISKKCQIYGFVKELPKILSVSDIVIARAGAMTLSELSLVGLPSVLVPYPHAADNHQMINAKILESKKAVRVVEDGDGLDRRLSAVLRDLIMAEKSLKMRMEMSENFKKFSRPQAGADIAEKILFNLG